MTMKQGIEEILERRIIVCVGTGGVGKTTMAAALALQAARRGQQALVVTIDPAKRLAGALGLKTLDHQPQTLDTETSAALGVPENGRLSAMMLDIPSTFDGLVERFAEDAEAKERILANPIYHQVSTTLAGSGEYAAMEKVFELLENTNFDLIVLDTPPAQNAVDFLDAPHRLLEFIDSRLVRLLIQPAFAAGRTGFRWFRGPTVRMLDLLERVVGLGFLRDLSEFLIAFEAMAEGFRERAQHVRQTLLGPESAFVLIAGASRQTSRNAEAFLKHIDGQNLPLKGIIINRIRLWDSVSAQRTSDFNWVEPRPEEIETLEEALQTAHPQLDSGLMTRSAVRVARQYTAWVKLDQQNTAAIRTAATQRGLFLAQVAERPEDVHDAIELGRVTEELFGHPFPDSTE